MSIRSVPEVVLNRARSVGAGGWVDELPGLVAEIERDWSLTVGRPYTGGTEAFVAEATLADGTEAVLKLLIPSTEAAVQNEVAALRIANGEGCAQLYRADVARSALLLERLGASMFDLGIPTAEQHEGLCRAAARIWRPAPGCGLPSGAEKGRRLVDFITSTWEELDRPCSERAVEHALSCAGQRIAAHDEERAVLVHGDLHQWNALEAHGGFKLVDPDGLLAEAEYDMGILMREDPVRHVGEMQARARWLATRTGLDATAIWEWGVVERVSTGLAATRIDLQPVAREMLAVADLVADA